MKTKNVCTALAGSAALLIATSILQAQAPPPAAIEPSAGNESIANIIDTDATTPAVDLAAKGLLWQFVVGSTVENVACSPDGTLAAIANDNRAVDIVDGRTGRSLVSLKLVTPEEEALLVDARRSPLFLVRALAFSKDGELLAVGTNTGQVKLFNAHSGQLEIMLDDPKASASDDKTPGKFSGFKRAIGSVTSVAFSPDRRFIAVAGESIAEEPFVFDGVEHRPLKVSGPGRLKIWNLQSGKVAHDLSAHSHADAVAFSPDGKLFASAGRWDDAAGQSAGVILWNPDSGDRVRTIAAAGNGGVRDVAFSPDGTLLAFCPQQFDKNSDTSASTLILAHAGSGIVEWQRRVAKSAKTAFSSDGKHVLAFSDGNTVRFFNTENGQRDYKLQAADFPQNGRWNDFAVAEGGRKLLFGGRGDTDAGFAIMWNMDALANAPKSAGSVAAISAINAADGSGPIAVTREEETGTSPALTPLPAGAPATVERRLTQRGASSRGYISGRAGAPPANALPGPPRIATIESAPPIAAGGPPTAVVQAPTSPVAAPPVTVAPARATNNYTRPLLAQAPPPLAPLPPPTPLPPQPPGGFPGVGVSPQPVPPQPSPGFPGAGIAPQRLPAQPYGVPAPPTAARPPAELPATAYTRPDPNIVSRSAPQNGRDIIRETKLKVLQKHYEETLNESVNLEKALFSAEPDDRAKIETKAKAMKEFLLKIEAELQALSSTASPQPTPKAGVNANPASRIERNAGEAGRRYPAVEAAPPGNTTPPAPAPRKSSVPAAYSPANATGAPDSGDVESDSPLAWCPASSNSKQEWLNVYFAKPTEIAEVRIHETYATGALACVSAIMLTQESDPKIQSAFKLWEGRESAEKTPYVRVITVSPGTTASGIRLEFDTSRINNWQEIDAVELVGRNGSRQWAQRAEASSYWGSGRRSSLQSLMNQPNVWSYRSLQNSPFTSGTRMIERPTDAYRSIRPATTPRLKWESPRPVSPASPSALPELPNPAEIDANAKPERRPATR